MSTARWPVCNESACIRHQGTGSLKNLLGREGRENVLSCLRIPAQLYKGRGMRLAVASQSNSKNEEELYKWQMVASIQELSNKSCSKQEWTQVVKFPIAAKNQLFKITTCARCFEWDSSNGCIWDRRLPRVLLKCRFSLCSGNRAL